MISITLTANNDSSGNRRQLWVITKADDVILDVIRHEDGKGMCSPNQVYPSVVMGPSITVSPKEFYRWLEIGRQLEESTTRGKHTAVLKTAVKDNSVTPVSRKIVQDNALQPV